MEELVSNCAQRGSKSKRNAKKIDKVTKIRVELARAAGLNFGRGTKTSIVQEVGRTTRVRDDDV